MELHQVTLLRNVACRDDFSSVHHSLHWRLRNLDQARAILAQVNGWATDSKNSPRHATNMSTLATELETAMNNQL